MRPSLWIPKGTLNEHCGVGTDQEISPTTPPTPPQSIWTRESHWVVRWLSRGIAYSMETESPNSSRDVKCNGFRIMTVP